MDFKLKTISAVLRAHFSTLAQVYTVSLVSGRIVVYKSKSRSVSSLPRCCTFVLTYSERWSGLTLEGEVTKQSSYEYGRFTKEHLEALRKNVQKALQVKERGTATKVAVRVGL